jgi:hypothetical protein
VWGVLAGTPTTEELGHSVEGIDNRTEVGDFLACRRGRGSALYSEAFDSPTRPDFQPADER